MTGTTSGSIKHKNPSSHSVNSRTKTAHKGSSPKMPIPRYNYYSMPQDTSMPYLLSTSQIPSTNPLYSQASIPVEDPSNLYYMKTATPCYGMLPSSPVNTIDPYFPSMVVPPYTLNPVAQEMNPICSSSVQQQPSISIIQSDTVEFQDCYKTFVDIPGLSEKDINIEVEGNNIVVNGNRTLSYANSRSILFKERFSGPFRICIPFLPEKVDVQNIRAFMENGVLTIHFKKMMRHIKEKQTQLFRKISCRIAPQKVMY
ncbi:hypothetical protein WA158_004949 [Blastocystis sp. Blastoise]